MQSSRSLFSYKNIATPSTKYPSFWAKLSSSKKRHLWKRIGISMLTFWILCIFTFAIRMQINVFRDLPDVSEVKDMVFSQATIITDRNGVELYKLFEQNREYIEYPKISQHTIDALVAIEDQRYREHEGLDPWGILRAAIMRKGGASTLPQQLMTNVFNMKAGVGASFTKRIAYKLRQIVLSKRLNTTLQKQIKAEKPGLSREETKKEMKKKILELYLNYIEFGNNAFGIEAAAKAYFGIPASELSILQSAVLASLPKSATLYSPLKESGRKNLLGYFTITDAQGKNYPFEGVLSQDIITKFRDAIQQADFSNKNTSNASTKFLVGLGSFTIIVEGKEYYVKYVNGRKDVVLSRMFEDGYINERELKQAYSDSLTISFQTSAFPIKAPHFVFWIKEKLQDMYGEKAVLEGGMIVKTTLDYDIQLKAEEAFKNNERTLRDNGANNSAMIYVDTNNGDVLSYIGSINYFDDEIQGQNDMVRKPRQSGSSIKPLVYSLGFQKLPLTIDTPIYDIPFQVGPDRPNNADDKFEGLLPLRLALGHSRNIPAVKMYLAAGGEEVVKPYLQQLGLSGVTDATYYGYPLALGAGEVTMLELADAYSHLTTSTPAELNPILEITSSDGSILYQKEVQEKAELIPEGIKYLLWKVLSEPNNRLPGRISKFNVAGLTYALKTGTSNVKTERGNRPRDGRLAAYMPDKLILMRAGNANATPMYQNAFGGTIHADPIKQFLKGLLENNYLSNTEMTNVETATLTISKITGNLPADNAPLELQTSTMAYVNSLPTAKDEPLIAVEYDAQCLGVASPLTPSAQLKQWYIFPALQSFIPSQADLEDIKTFFQASAASSSDATGTLSAFSGAKVSLSSLNILTNLSQDYCENRQPIINTAITINILSPQDTRKISPKPELMYSIKSDSDLKSISASVDETNVFSKIITKNIAEELGNTILDLSAFTPWQHTLTVQAITTKGFMNQHTISVVLQSSDKEPPYIIREQSKVIASETGKDVTFIFNDHLSAVLGGEIFAGEEKLLAFSGRLAKFTTTADEVEVVVKDAYENTLKETVPLTAW